MARLRLAEARVQRDHHWSLVRKLVAVMGAVSFWRHVASAPDSKAAKAAIARAMAAALACRDS